MSLATVTKQGLRTYTILSRKGNLILMQVTRLGIKKPIRWELGIVSNAGQTEAWPVPGKARRISRYESKKQAKEAYENHNG